MSQKVKAKFSRRSFMGASAILGAAWYIDHRGLRFPRMGFEHRPLTKSLHINDVSIEMRDFIALVDDQTSQGMRAIAPEPSLILSSSAKTKLQINICNVSDKAILIDNSPQGVSVAESVDGINRIINVSFSGANISELKWHLPNQEGLDFAVIGDSGAGLELEWVLDRANELAAQFLIHLGDFNYGKGEYARAIELFKTSAIPCFVTIGNHDYNESGLIYQKFLDHLGPMNHSFSFAGTRFVNLDSAANFFPASSGLRGRLIDDLLNDANRYQDHVVFTHRPFEDPRPGRGHDISGFGEIEWLSSSIKAIGADAVLTGHVHRSAELDFRGIHQWTAGEGLGFEDIVHQKHVASILMGRVEAGQKVQYQWQPLNMPWSAHTSHTHEVKLIKEQPKEKLDWYRKNILKSGV